MSVSTSALNLADYALNSNSPMVRAITYSLILNDNVMQDVPLFTRKSLIANGVRFEGNLPTVNWSQINAEGVTVKGTPKAYQEQVFLLRNYVDVDKLLVEDENQITDPRATQAGVVMKAITYDLNYKFINNNHATGDANSFTGIRYRIDNGSTYGVRSENKIDGSTLDLRRANATQATANTLFELLDQLLWSVDAPAGGASVSLFMNEVMHRRLAFLARLMGTSGGFDVTKDQFGRTIDTYKGALIREIGYKADQSTRIITNTENTDGTDGSSVQTSIYAVNFGADHFFGWQFAEPNVQDLGLLNNGVIYRTLIDWSIGLMNASTRSLGRLYDLKMA